jgi:Holliday junction DNA helicase RuvA
MIGQLRGILLEKQPPSLLLDVQGVAYEIDAPMGTFYHLPETGLAITLHTHLIIREDAHHLYGFYSRAERQLFRTLLKVNGVGPRLALTILSSMNPDEFVRCVSSNDIDSLVSLPGVGRKTADRLLIEMRDRLKDWRGVALRQVPAASNRIDEAVAALVALGYKSQQASRTVARLDDGAASSETLIRKALQEGVA